MKKINEEIHTTKAEKREKKKRPRMKMHGRGLLTQKTHAGLKLTKKN